MAGSETDQESHNGHKTHRSVELLATLKRLGGSARTSHLADTMDVSEETVRRTIKRLSKDGLVSRVHGGVYLVGKQATSSFHQRIGELSHEKQQMGRMVASLIEDGASLFMDVGSTTLYAAEALREKQNLMIVTNSISIAQTLMNQNNNRVYLAGGELQNDVGGTFGSATLKFVSKFQVDFAILSAAAIDPVRGFLLNEENEADLAQTYVSHARKKIIVADHSKANHSAPIVSCEPDEVDIFITDEAPPAKLRDALIAWKIKILVAPPKKKKKK